MRLMAATGMVQIGDDDIGDDAREALVEAAYEYRLGAFGSPLTLEAWAALHPAERGALVEAGRRLLRDLADDVRALLAPDPAPAGDPLDAMLEGATAAAMRRVVEEVTA